MFSRLSRYWLQSGFTLLPLCHVCSHLYHRLPARAHQTLQGSMWAGEVWLRAGDEALQSQLARQPGLQRAAAVRPRSLHLTRGHCQGRRSRYIHHVMSLLLSWYGCFIIRSVLTGWIPHKGRTVEVLFVKTINFLWTKRKTSIFTCYVHKFYVLSQYLQPFSNRYPFKERIFASIFFMPLTIL